MIREEFKSQLIRLVVEALAGGLSRTEILDELEIHVEELEQPIEPYVGGAAFSKGKCGER